MSSLRDKWLRIAQLAATVDLGSARTAEMRELAALAGEAAREALDAETRVDASPDTERTPIPLTTAKTYFIQDTRQYVGNSVLWWRVDGHGYTCELSEAWEVSEEEARRIERTRGTDKAWPAHVVRAAASTHVDMQKLRRIPTPGDDHVG
jgi:hypothetical protein